jgi:hypothetical protein
MKMKMKILIAAACILAASGAHAFTRYGTFESGVSGTNGFSWPGSTVTQSSEQVREGSYSAKFTFPQGDNGDYFTFTGGYTLSQYITQGGELWVRAYYYFPSGFDFSSASEGYHKKILRFRDNDGGAHCKDILAFCDSSPYSWDNCNGTGNGEITASIEEIDWVMDQTGQFFSERGTWVCYEQYVKADSGGNGIHRIWKNGVLIYSRSGVTTIASGGSIKEVLVFSAWNGGSPQNQSAYVDSIVITNETPSATDASGNRMIGPIGWSGGGSDTTPPTVTITGPTSAAAYTTATSPITVSGGGSDNVGVTSVTWSCTTCTPSSGTASGTTSWSISGIALTESETVPNPVVVTAHDSAGNTSTDTISITYDSTPWSDTTAPTIAITSPTALAHYESAGGTVSIAGTAADDIGVAAVTWACPSCTPSSGTASGTASWSVANLVIAPSSLGPELIANPTFDSATTGWAPYNSILTQGTNAGRAQTLSVADNGLWSEAYQIVTGLETNAYYRASALVYVSDMTDSDGSIFIDFAAARTNTIGDARAQDQALAGQWVTISTVFQLTTGTTVNLRLYGANASPAYFDDVSLRKITGVNSFTATASDAASNSAADTLYLIYLVGGGVPATGANISGLKFSGAVSK